MGHSEILPTYVIKTISILVQNAYKLPYLPQKWKLIHTHGSSNSAPRSQHFHSGTALNGVNPVMVWRVAGDVTCSSVASWTSLIRASQENGVVYVIILPGLTYLRQLYLKRNVVRKSGLHFWNQRQKFVQKWLLLFKHHNPCRAV
jgi:hypothetical protein